LKILHIDSGRGWRGGQRQVYLLIKGLKDKKIKQFALVSSKKLKSKLEKLGIGSKLWKYNFELSPRAYSFFTIIKKEKPDLIHFHDSRTVSLGIFTKIKTVVTRRVDFELKNKFSIFKYRKMDKIIAISRNIKDILGKYGLENIDIIYSGIDPGEIETKLTKKECREKFGFKNKIVFVNTASLVDHKGHIFLLEAFNILKQKGIEPELHIAGSGKLKDFLVNFKESNDLKNIKFHGYVSKISQFLKAGDIFILTSHKEGLCTSLIDAMAAGLPVIATKAGGIPEVVGDSGILAKNKNPVNIAQKIEYLLKNKEIREELPKKATKRLNEKFLYKRMITEYLENYSNILKNDIKE